VIPQTGGFRARLKKNWGLGMRKDEKSGEFGIKVIKSVNTRGTERRGQCAV